MNPFTWFPRPASPREHQSNANWATYERMAAVADLASFDRDKVRAPQGVIARAHTSKWVEKELIRIAAKARRDKKHALTTQTSFFTA